MNYELTQVPRVLDKRGNLSFVEAMRHVPFIIKRVHWVYDVPGGEIRGGHAFKKNQEFIISLSGSFDVVIGEGEKQKRIALRRSYYGLYLPNLVWRKFDNFSTNSVALILNSQEFDESDYLRDYGHFNDLLND